MGMSVPQPDNARDQALALMVRKDNIEAELETHISILKANNADMQTPLVDAEGFPRADMDIYAVRGARVRIIELRNDLRDVIDAIGKALEGVFDPTLVVHDTPVQEAAAGPLKPFAKVDGVAPGSPAADALLQRGDLLVKFGRLDQNSIKNGSLQPLAEIVAENEGRVIPIRVLRDDKIEFLSLTPRKNWGGRGMLGCHIVNYTPS
ncbi:hypothetical protein D9613_006124 [Agrocybe pediades]|uniref:Probable 26S proteasome regulatory subunit p27 n=1 Tax=Agrocybe pediades TaxID=84607 RepID=A0A8H4QV16_9AGAR|nr:hypothetical protein D9613_006124 [Agrocybe pediades]